MKNQAIYSKLLGLIVLSIFSFHFSFLSAEEMPEGYYDAINGTKDAELKGTLKEIIRDHTAIPYGSGSNSSWYVFYYSDRDENGYCMDMYCDTWQKFGTPGEKVSGCNIEHSFAKSWWGGSENDAYKDCYHLNPSNSTANSARGNYPLGVPVKDFKSNSGSLKVGKMHHPTMDVDFWVFEPKDEYKGDFARAYFYMATCYGKDKNGNIDNVCSNYNGWRLDNSDVGSKFAMQNDNYLEFQPWEQEVLIKWHRQDPVSEKEIKRADAVSDFQHNRNPFIDYPFLAEYIWGDYAGEELDMSHLMASFEEAFVPGESNGWRDGGSVTPTPKPKYGVTWSVDGEEIRVDSVVENKKVLTLPDKPESCSQESSVFMGWSTSAIEGATDEAPAVLYNDAAELPAVTADVTYYAVFAKETMKAGAAAATYTYDADHQQGWTNTGTNKGSYWLLDSGKELTSPTVDLSGLSSIKVKIRTFGGTSYNVLDVSANGQKIATITADGSSLKEYEWTNTGSLSGLSPITFSSNYGSNKGIGISSATINATGVGRSYSRYITTCGEVTAVSYQQSAVSARKVLREGQIVIIYQGREYNILGL